MNEKDSIRDFIYLDIERVRSFVSQISKGLPSERVTGSEHQTGGEVSAEGGIPLFAKGTGGANYHFLRSSSETKSLHDHIFAELLQGLQEKHLLTDIPSHHIQWEPSSFCDGMFVLATGIIKFVDYRTSAEFLENLPKVIKSVIKIMSVATTNAPNTQMTKQMESELRALPTKEVAAFMDQFYSEVVRIKVFPYGNKEQAFIGMADKALLRYTVTTLTGLYGTTIDANWKCLLQVNLGKQHPIGRFTKQSDQIEDNIENMIDNLSQFSVLTQGIQYPSVAMTPIAIFRDIVQP